MNDYPKLPTSPGPLPPEAQALLSEHPAQASVSAAIVWETAAPLRALSEYGKALSSARRNADPVAEAEALLRVKGAAIAGRARGLSEYQLATLLGVARNTVRSALGKQPPARKKAQS